MNQAETSGRRDAARAVGLAGGCACERLLPQLLAEQRALGARVDALLQVVATAGLAGSVAHAAPPDVVKLLEDTRRAVAGKEWTVRDLRALGLLNWPEKNSRVGQVLGEHVGRVIGGLRLQRLTKRPTNDGHLYRIEAVDGDDQASSSPTGPDTMHPLELAWRKPR